MRYQQSDPDVRLMLRVKEDDVEAFEELVQRYQGRLVRLLEHLGPRRDLADDMTQEVFLRVFRARKNYQPGAKFSTWLFTIAGNVARNAVRSSGRRQEVNEVDAGSTPSGSQAAVLASLATDASGLMPTRQIEGAERAEVVRAAVQMLNPRQREALLLSKFEGLSYLEIADVMGLSTKAVKSLLSRARVNLKDLLVPYVEAGVLSVDVVAGNGSSRPQHSKDR
ncbi:RNA polymerase sigma factor [Roseimaritima sediminicola]|uniref:RNA polymerase sigma factor n=1 Tax=Roseimaritima sediminicola TaxID=2662066 RepID=UPI0012983794|nr:sigma-70 family RNA polymerase sigma factor [Roseimaritima sediminicola]